MAESTTIDILGDVKNALGITGNYQDKTITLYITEVKEYMKGAGVSSAIVDSSLAIGVIARGVADLWNYGSGSAELSPYFIQRVCQLAYESEV